MKSTCWLCGPFDGDPTEHAASIEHADAYRARNSGPTPNPKSGSPRA